MIAKLPDRKAVEFKTPIRDKKNLNSRHIS